MELIYLWVEEYKNIKNQGFNFSPRFMCHYDKNKNELKIEEKKDYVSIFPPNINVTALVGENGSGKSSIGELLILTFFEWLKLENISNYFVLLYSESKNKILISSFSQETKSFSALTFNNKILQDNSILYSNTENRTYHFHSIQENSKNSFFNLYYNPAPEIPSSFFQSHMPNSDQGFLNPTDILYQLDYKPNEYNIFAFPFKDKTCLDIRKNSNIAILNMFKIKGKIQALESIEKTLKTDKLKFFPVKISLSLSEAISPWLMSFNITFKNKKDLSLKNLHAYFLLSLVSSAFIPSDANIEFQLYGIKNKTIINYLNDILNADLNYKTDRSHKKYKQAIYDDIDNFIALTQDIQFEQALDTSFKGFNVDAYETARLIDTVKKLGKSDILLTKIQDTKDIEAIIPCLPSYIQVDALDASDVKFSDFSYGEKNIITFIYSLSYYIDFFITSRSQLNVFHIVLDEIETGFNPKWQKHMINILVCLLQQYNDKEFIVTIISHSPFILSDIPKGNVIFLEKGKQVYPNIETFGANIHTLLSHGFFMKEGLMGEFAKEKINEAIEYLNKKELTPEETDYCENIISIIGEPMLKRQLQKMLDSKPLSEVEKIKKQIAELQQKLEEHQHAQN